MTARSFAIALAVVAVAVPAAAQPAPPAGAASCSGCHPATASAGGVPPINGRPADESLSAMADFRAGKRDATVMGRIAKGFTDDETRAIAAWLAAQR